MNVETKELEQHEIQLTIEVETERVDNAKRAAARRLSRKVNVPGFRRGKAPYPVLARYLGEGAVMEEVLEELGPQLYEEALDSTELATGGPGQLVDAEFDPLKLIFKVPRQSVTDLGDYRALRIDFDEVEIQDEAVNAALLRLREARALLEPVDRPAEMGDVVTLDVRGEIGEGEDADELLDDKDFEILLGDEREWPMPGFDEHIAGMRVDETHTFEQAYPDDYANASLAGQLVHFNVACHEIKSRTLPEPDDDFAASVDDEYETILDLRVAIREQLQKNADAERDEAYRNKVLEAVVAGADVRFAPSVLEREVDGLLEGQKKRVQERSLRFEDYLRMENKTEEEYRAKLEELAGQQLRRSFVLAEVIKAEGIQISDGELDTQIDRTAAAFGEAANRIRESLGSAAGRRDVHLDLLTHKAIERLAAIAKGEAPPLPELKTEAAETDTAEPAEPEKPEDELESSVAAEADVPVQSEPDTSPGQEEPRGEKAEEAVD